MIYASALLRRSFAVQALKPLSTPSAVTATPESLSSSKKFDAHTYSIWATEMSRRGKPEEALRMLENVLQERKVPRDNFTVMYNTAIDICGHHGKFNRAWKLFNDVLVNLL